MNEKDLAILEQYDLQVKSTRRGRGSFLCETDRGLVQVTEFSGSRERLFFQNRVLHFLQEQGRRADVILENKEGNLVSLDRYANGYVVKEWFSGRECDTKNTEDILAAVRHLAELHKVLRLPAQTGKDIKTRLSFTEESAEHSCADEMLLAAQVKEQEASGSRSDLEYSGEPLTEEIERHTREMKKVRNFMRTRKKKSAFELRFLEMYDQFMEQAWEVQERLRNSGAPELYRQCIRERRVCHGDYSQHNIFFDREGAVAVNYARCCFDTQVADFYQFFRKIMEKQGWNQKLGIEMIHAYQTVRPLSDTEFENFCIRLAYPEKFWKLANHYFNSRKTWMPEKNLQKLEILDAQEKRRGDFVKFLY